MRRLRDGLIGLCALALAGVAQPLPASASPTTGPTTSPPASSTGSASAGPVLPTPSTSTSHRVSGETYSVTVSPARLVVGQGELDRTQLLTLVNRGQAPVSLTVEKRNFVALPDGGLNYRPDAPYGAADWVTVSPTALSLDPGESQQVRATIDVPREPEAGDHHVALIFLAPSGGKGNVKVNRGIGAPVYLTVPGPTDDSVRLNSLTGPRWSLWGDPSLTASLTSTGTVHRDFRGPGAVSAGTPSHLSRFPDFTVVRGSDRVVSTTWDAPLVCVCQPSLTITNQGQAPQTVSTRVVVVPWWLLAALALVLAGVAAVLLRRHRRAARTRGRDGGGDLAHIMTAQ